MAHLFVIAGHGAGDPGAVGNGYTEAERVRALANRIKALGGDNVTLGDTSRDWYADNGISSLSMDKSWQIIELHMDSASASARGGHVIIKSGFSPDTYDTALANFIGGILPGRSNLIVGRSDLANPNRAAAKGYSYRLVEFGFITNSTDVNIFNTKMDDIARGVLNCFGIGSSSSGSDKWVWDNGKNEWWYRYSNGSYPKSQWLQLGNTWYYFDGNGYALRNCWLQKDGYWYYFNDDCSMATGWKWADTAWYYLNPQSGSVPKGAMLDGWQFIDGKWYYLNAQTMEGHKHGDMITGVFDQGIYTYFCREEKENGNPVGSMVTGWRWIDDAWYYFNVEMDCQPVGSMFKNHWLTENGHRYYLKDDGKMAKDESIEISGKTYTFNNSGEMV